MPEARTALSPATLSRGVTRGVERLQTQTSNSPWAKFASSSTPQLGLLVSRGPGLWPNAQSEERVLSRGAGQEKQCRREPKIFSRLA